MDLYQQVIAKSRYCRFIESANRREHWPETVNRYLDFMAGHLKEKHQYDLPDDLREELFAGIVGLNTMPSMRAVMTAGEALKRDNTAGYNCSYVPVDDPKAFDEAMFILLCGTGVGFSVERQHINKLPEVPDTLAPSNTVIHVADSKEGWARGLRQLVALLYSGEVPKWDTSVVRKAGARLKTFGGRASGPEPLIELFNFVVGKFQQAVGRKLNSIECHDIMCKIGDVVVVGGVRRSAMISLSNLSDDRMREAKSGQWWATESQRALANNSVCYTEKPEVGAFMREWLSLYNSKSGERGIFNREASVKKAAENGRRDPNHEFGTNPCSEIILRPYQFCNLTEVVVRADDTVQTLSQKVRLATILGTFQSSLTNFPYLRKVWQKNTEEERLLGVSMTGILDNTMMSTVGNELKNTLEYLRLVAVETNALFADAIGVPHSTAITCVKPSGTVSQLVDSASGIHPRHDHYYIRRIRQDKKDPITQFMIDQGVPYEACAMKPETTVIFSFPQKAPDGCRTRNDIGPIEHLELWLAYQRYWCEHKPSITVYVKEKEWPTVGAWVWEHFDEISGVSFLPYDGGTYKQAPYETIDQEAYEKMYAESVKSLNWGMMVEEEDGTKGSQELACSAGGCDLVSL
jgi:ribonucleoside-diphosphate reductase alpha chain